MAFVARDSIAHALRRYLLSRVRHSVERWGLRSLHETTIVCFVSRTAGAEQLWGLSESHPSVVFLWVVFFTAGLGVAIVTPQSGFYAEGKPWDAAACSEFLTFFTIGLVIVIFKNGIGGLWRGIERLCTSRPFTGTLAVQLGILAVVSLVVGATQSSPKATTSLPASLASASNQAVPPSAQAVAPQSATTKHAPTQMWGQFTGDVVNTTSNLEVLRTGTPADEWRAHWLFRGFPAPVRQWASDRLSSRHGICICCAESQLRHHVHRTQRRREPERHVRRYAGRHWTPRRDIQIGSEPRGTGRWANEFGLPQRLTTASVEGTAIMNWKKALLIGLGWGVGTALGLTILVGGFLRYQSKPKPPKPWDSKSIKAEYDHVTTEGDDNHVVIYYVLKIQPISIIESQMRIT